MRFIDEWEINKTHWEIFQSLLVHVFILWFEFSCSSEKHETFIHFGWCQSPEVKFHVGRTFLFFAAFCCVCIAANTPRVEKRIIVELDNVTAKTFDLEWLKNSLTKIAQHFFRAARSHAPRRKPTTMTNFQRLARALLTLTWQISKNKSEKAII